MRLACSTWGMPDVAIAEAIPRLAEMGYQGIELGVLPRFRTALERLGPAERQQIRELTADHGLALTAIAAHSSLLDPDSYEAGVRRLTGAIDLAAELVPEDPPPINTTPGGRPEQWEAVKQRLVDEFAALGEYAAVRGVALAVEPHVGAAVDEPEEILWLVQQVNLPNVGINADYSHFQARGLSVEESIVPLVPWVVHTHVKGNRGRWPDHEFLTPGEDDFDYAPYLRAMYDAGYRGFQTVEISNMVRARPDYEPFAHAQLAHDTLAAAYEAAGISHTG